MRATFAIPGDLNTPSGGYGYDRAVIAAGPGVGLELAHLALPGGFPFPTGAALAQAARLLAATPADRPLLVDGLALGALPEAALAGVRAPLAALLHHPLALEAGLSEAQAQALRASEGAALARCRAIVTTSAATVRDAAALFGIAPSLFSVARPGLARAAMARGGGETPVILCVASLIPRKGHDVLIDALARLADRPWCAALYGAQDFAPDWAAQVRARIAAAGLGARIALHGPVSSAALADAYHGADIFCLPSRHEGYGMVFAEAMAHGLPVLAADIAAAREVIGPGAGRLSPPDDAAALAENIAALLDDPARRRAMAAAAHARAHVIPGWDATARAIRAALEGIAP